jgi:hypothetical protein
MILVEINFWCLARMKNQRQLPTTFYGQQQLPTTLVAALATSGNF